VTPSGETPFAPYRAPGGTLFVRDPVAGAWCIVCWDGSEALVPEGDLEAFMRRCLPDPPPPRGGPHRHRG